MSRVLDTFRNQVRDFTEKEIAPRAAEIDRANDFPTDLWKKMGGAGLYGLTVSDEYGGTNQGYLAHTLAMEEISRASGAIGLSYAAHSNLCIDNLYRNGTPAQREHYLPRLCSGEWVGALAMSEPGAGSDIIGSMSCHAEPRGEMWVANGTKTWITNGPDADVLIVYMRTATSRYASKNLTAFLVEKGMPGFRAEDPMDKLGMRGSNTGSLIFEDCAIPQENVLGKVNDGARMMMDGLDAERLILAGGPVGLMQAAFDLVLPFMHERKQFGQPIGKFELMQARLADVYTALQASRAYTYDVARRFDHSRALRKETAGCLMFASERAVEVALAAIQILGARGYMNESPAGRLLRDAKVYEIGGGTNEIRHILIGRELFVETDRQQRAEYLTGHA
ncbi:MAG: acyl-CoA dehydrogenase family protein [Chromatiales bacterium]|nr:acyl-CoA dehydrogenase family protein [Chromatiales bacterium]